MKLQGCQLIGRGESRDGTSTFRGVEPATGAELEPAFAEATEEEVDRALALAAAAHPAFEDAGRERRAEFLERAAAGIEALGDALLERAQAETALPPARLAGERGRTCGQLRAFAGVVRAGNYLNARIDRADPERSPLPKPDVRSMERALGPVAVFGASNFPLAFSVAGGDSTSALAAGCPVVVKGHPAHPGTSELVARVLIEAAADCGLPEGTVSMVQGAGYEVGARLVEHPATRAVAFTGSLAGGRALFDLAAQRPDPIPVFAEMGSINPVFVLPGALAARGEALAQGLAGSVTLGVGQFCTNPGLVVLQKGAAAEAFVEHLRVGLSDVGEGSLLHAGIRSGFERGRDQLAAVAEVESLLEFAAIAGSSGAQPALFLASAATLLAEPSLQDEVFGPSTLVITCEDAAEMRAVAGALAGQLTGTIQAEGGGDDELAAELAGLLAQRVGRVLYGGFPTGVEVCSAMVHGGPYPASTDARSTSVGMRAIERFTRPVAYQSFPQALLPLELRDAGPPSMRRLVDGVLD